VRILWFAEAPEQCEGAVGRRGGAHGGPEPASKRARDARIAIRRDAHNPSLSANDAFCFLVFGDASDGVAECGTCLVPFAAPVGLVNPAVWTSNSTCALACGPSFGRYRSR
jgi:hypothetical protein